MLNWYTTKVCCVTNANYFRAGLTHLSDNKFSKTILNA